MLKSFSESLVGTVTSLWLLEKDVNGVVASMVQQQICNLSFACSTQVYSTFPSNVVFLGGSFSGKDLGVTYQ